MRTRRAGLSRHAAVAKAIDYMLKRWDRFARSLDGGRRADLPYQHRRGTVLRGTALGKRS